MPDHDTRLKLAAKALLGQDGCEHHDTEPEHVSDYWRCPKEGCVSGIGDAEVHAFAYPEGKPEDHKL